MKLPQMTLETLLETWGGKAECIGNTCNVQICALSYDSRTTPENALFFCVRGGQDGHDYAADAVRRGAVALVTERTLSLDVPQIVVDDSRIAMGEMAAAFYGYPARRVKMVGITGTKGKTSATFIIKAIGETAGFKVGIIGTVGIFADNQKLDIPRNTASTPMGLDLQYMLWMMAEMGMDWVVMEVTSIALDQHRAAGIFFDVGAFMNLSQDHLDYHITMQAYAEAKARLFEQCERAVINYDDAAFAQMCAATRATSREVLPYSLDDDTQAVACRDLKLDAQGARFKLRLPDGMYDATLRLRGRFSVYNGLLAAGCAYCLGVPSDVIVKGLAAATGVEGRFEVVESPAPFVVIVDYAHNPDSLEKILIAARAITRGRLLAVFGAGGDRDTAKRPMMGQVAGQLSDYVYLTSDNPRTEPPMLILEAIEAGVKPTGTPYEVIENRKEAISAALRTAREGDLVLIAGKGHETYQEIMGVKHPFDDRQAAREALAELGY